MDVRYAKPATGFPELLTNLALNAGNIDDAGSVLTMRDLVLFVISGKFATVVKARTSRTSNGTIPNFVRSLATVNLSLIGYSATKSSNSRLLPRRTDTFIFT